MWCHVTVKRSRHCFQVDKMLKPAQGRGMVRSYKDPNIRHPKLYEDHIVAYVGSFGLSKARSTCCSGRPSMAKAPRCRAYLTLQDPAFWQDHDEISPQHTAKQITPPLR